MVLPCRSDCRWGDRPRCSRATSGNIGADCGLPFPHPQGEDAVCAECARETRSWDRARAVLRYDKNSRHLVLALKHGDRTHLARAFGRWMHRIGGTYAASPLFASDKIYAFSEEGDR